MHILAAFAPDAINSAENMKADFLKISSLLFFCHFGEGRNRGLEN
jgi:hypothetical protein